MGPDAGQSASSLNLWDEQWPCPGATRLPSEGSLLGRTLPNPSVIDTLISGMRFGAAQSSTINAANRKRVSGHAGERPPMSPDRHSDVP
jgi:hypothetical protein